MSFNFHSCFKEVLAWKITPKDLSGTYHDVYDFCQGRRQEVKVKLAASLDGAGRTTLDEARLTAHFDMLGLLVWPLMGLTAKGVVL